MSKHHVHVAAIFRHYHPILTGAGERFRRYAPKLAQQNIFIDIHTSATERSPAHEAGPPIVYRCPTGKTSTASIDVAILKAARLHYERTPDTPKVCQVISLSRPLLIQLLRWKIAKGIRVVFVGTMVEPLAPPKGRLGKLKQLCRRTMFRMCVDHIIASSSTMADSFLNNGVAKTPVTVIPNGVDTKRFSPLKNQSEKITLREQLGIPQAARVTLFVGNLIPRKGIDKLLEAWSIMIRKPEHTMDLLVVIGPRVRPTFVGDKRQRELHEFQTRLDATASRIPNSNIKFYDPVENVESFFRAADLFAFASLKEGMGNVIMEAMACGLPVATTHFLGFPEAEFGKEGIHHLKLDFDPNLMAKQLSNVLLDQDLLTSIGDNARKWTENHLGLEATLEKYAVVYRNLANRKKATR